MRISDWSSDVCSSDLVIAIALYLRNRRPRLTGSQTWLVLATVPLAIVIAWGLTRDAELSGAAVGYRSEEHTSELQSLMRISYAVFCLKKKKIKRIIKLNTERHSKRTSKCLIVHK